MGDSFTADAPDSFIPDTPSPLSPAASFYKRKMLEAGAVENAQPTHRLPGLGEMIKRRVTEDWPTFLGMAATAPIGGGGLIGPAKRALTGGAVDAAGELLRGTPPQDAALEGGKFMGGQALGEGVMGAAKGALNSTFKAAFDSRTAKLLAEHLRKTVPAWKNFEGSMKGLYDMIYSPSGYNSLHEMADESFRGVMKRAQGAGGPQPEISIPEPVARMLKIPVQGPAMTEGPSPLTPDASVYAADAAKAALGQWKKHPGEYREVMQALDAAGIGDPAIRTAYKTAMGTKSYLDSTRAFDGTQYRADAAQSGLSRLGEVEGELHRRQLPEIYDIIKGPLSDTVKPINSNFWSRKMLGALAGESVGLPLGAPAGISGLAGAAAADTILPRFSNVPIPPAMKVPLNLGAAGVNYLMQALLPKLLGPSPAGASEPRPEYEP